MLVINSIKLKYHDLTKKLFHKTVLGMSFLTRIIGKSRISFLPSVQINIQKHNISEYFITSLSKKNSIEI